MASILELQRELKAFEESNKGAGLHLRLDLADMLQEGLRKKGWNQQRLAAATGMKESFISRLIHSDANCTVDVIARVLHAVGVRPKLIAQARKIAVTHVTTFETIKPYSPYSAVFHGQEEIEKPSVIRIGTYDPPRAVGKIGKSQQSEFAHVVGGRC